MTSTFDASLLEARDQARAALEEITDAKSIGVDDGHDVHAERVVTLLFECRLEGYLGWRWAASVTKVDDEAPVSVLEVGLLPGDGSVLAPDWVPWSERLAQYRETQARQAAEEAAAAQAAADELAEEDDVDPEDDLLDNDFSDYDDEIDGVDIDEIDEDEIDDEEFDDESEADSEDDGRDEGRAGDDADDDGDEGAVDDQD